MRRMPDETHYGPESRQSPERERSACRLGLRPDQSCEDDASLFIGDHETTGQGERQGDVPTDGEASSFANGLENVSTPLASRRQAQDASICFVRYEVHCAVRADLHIADAHSHRDALFAYYFLSLESYAHEHSGGQRADE